MVLRRGLAILPIQLEWLTISSTLRMLHLLSMYLAVLAFANWNGCIQAISKVVRYAELIIIGNVECIEL